MADWRDVDADQDLRLAQKMLEQQGEINALRAERDALKAAIERVQAIKRSPGVKSVSSFVRGQDDGWDQALTAVDAALAIPESNEDAEEDR